MILFHNKLALSIADPVYEVYEEKDGSSYTLEKFILDKYPSSVDVWTEKIETIYAERNIPRVIVKA